MSKVYLETSFISYLTARLSRDLVTAAHQQLTHQWWETRRGKFELYVSQHVLDEAGAGDRETARKRLLIVRELPLLDLNAEVIQLASDLVQGGPFPEVAATDAAHVAVATIHGMDFLLTWNCRHIANAEIAHAAAAVCKAKGHTMPRVCTPEQLMGG